MSEICEELILRIDLKGEEAKRFLQIKRKYGVQANTEVIRLLLAEAADKLLNPLKGSSGESPKTAEKEGPRAEEREILEAA